MNATKVTYTADGRTKVFYFNFPYFQKDDIVLVVNDGEPLPRFAIYTGKPNSAAAYPYTGGAVRFPAAPAAGTKIEIRRELVMARPCDYQPTMRICPEDLNRDFNFNLENMKDFRRILDDLKDKINALADNTDLLASIDKINTAVADLAQIGDINNIATLDDIAPIAEAVTALAVRVSDLEDRPAGGTDNNGQIQAAIAELNTTVSALESAVAAINNRLNDATPATPLLNYTDSFGNLCARYIETDSDIIATGIAGSEFIEGWYKINKKTRWVEQGAQNRDQSAAINTINLLVPLADATYSLQVTPYTESAVGISADTREKTSSSFRVVKADKWNWIYWESRGLY